MRFFDAMEHHWTKMAREAGVLGTYRRNSQSISNLTLVPANRNTSQSNTDNLVQSTKDADWICRADSINFGEGQVVPQRGDTVAITENGISRKWELTSSAGERAYDPCDGYGLMLRLHTKEV